MFMPIVVAIFGVIIMNWAGVNDNPGTPNAFKAMLSMEFFGWIGAVLTFGGIGYAVRTLFFKKK